MTLSVHNPTVPAPRIKKRRNEQAYVMDAHRRLRCLGIPCKWEAPLLGRSIDLAFLYEGAVLSVEFKLKDWRRGLQQARDHLLGVDYAYLCLPGKNLSERLKNEAVAAGIGLLVYRDDAPLPFSIAIEAEQSNEQWSVAREQLIKMMKV